MNIDTAKTISIIDLLRTLDHAPVSIRGDRYNYLSPIRTEKEPSFCVSKKRNEWYDFGLGQGGDIINLSKRLFETNDVSEVLNRLDKLNISHVEHSCKTIKAAAVQTAVKMEKVHLHIIRKTKRFAIPERAVYFLKTKRTAGVLPHPKNFRPAYAGIHIMQERSPDTIRTPFFSFCRFAPAFRASRYAASLNALYATTLCALTSLPRKARREPTNVLAFDAS